MPPIAAERRSPGSSATPAARRIAAGLLLLIPLAFTGVVYYPITGNYFFVDDFINLYRIVNEDLVTYLLRPHGGHLLVVRNAFFFAFARLFATNAALYFWGALATHLVNVSLLFVLIRILTGSLLLACFGATLWGISPMNQGSLGWYSVYGQVVATTFVLGILCQIASAAERGVQPGRLTRLFWYVLALAAVTSFGVAIGIAMVLPIVAALLLPRRGSLLRTPLLGLLAVVPALYVALPPLFTWVAGEPAPLEGGVVTNWETWAHSPALLYHLVTYGMTQFVAGGFYAPAQYPDLVSSVVAGSLAVLAIVAFVLARPAAKRQCLAFGLLLVAAYGTVAIARAVYFPAGLAHFATAARYHYVPTAFLAVIFCVLLSDVGGQAVHNPRVKEAALVMWLLSATVCVLSWPLDLDHHDRDRAEVERVMRSIWTAAHQQPKGADVYVTNRGFRPMGYLFLQEDFPGWGGVFAIFYPNNVVDGRHVHFVSKNPKVVAATKNGRRTRDLFVDQPPAPATAPPARPAAAGS